MSESSQTTRHKLQQNLKYSAISTYMCRRTKDLCRSKSSAAQLETQIHISQPVILTLMKLSRYTYQDTVYLDHNDGYKLTGFHQL